MATEQHVLDITDASFQADVVEASKTRPVVVDFWAPWCGPCRILGPIIEKVAGEFAGDVVLAKMNVDENQQSSMQYRVQGIPAVKAFRDGKVVNEFTGALPEAQVRAFFQSLAPTAADRAAAEAEQLVASGDIDAAEARFREILATTPDDPKAVIGMANILAVRDELDEADSLLKRLPADRHAKVMRHQLFLESYARKHAHEDLLGEAKANPRDPRARYRWGLMLAAGGDYVSALGELLESVRYDKTWENGSARKSMLAIFEILGMDSTITRDYQRRLENVLF
ncbi:MAG: thioredoxin [Chloroflexota bacterium]|nr:thioredoxin [Chloroflexota bacterium]